MSYPPLRHPAEILPKHFTIWITYTKLSVVESTCLDSCLAVGKQWPTRFEFVSRLEQAHLRIFAPKICYVLIHWFIVRVSTFAPLHLLWWIRQCNKKSVDDRPYVTATFPSLPCCSILFQISSWMNPSPRDTLTSLGGSKLGYYWERMSIFLRFNQLSTTLISLDILNIIFFAYTCMWRSEGVNSWRNHGCCWTGLHCSATAKRAATVVEVFEK